MKKEEMKEFLLLHTELAAYSDAELVDCRTLTFAAPTNEDKACIRYSQKSELQSVLFAMVATLIFLSVLVYNMIDGIQKGVHPTAYFTLAALIIVFAVLVIHGIRLYRGARGVLYGQIVFRTGKSILKKPGMDPFRDGGQMALILLDKEKKLLCPVPFNRTDFNLFRENDTVILANLYTNSYKVFPKSH